MSSRVAGRLSAIIGVAVLGVGAGAPVQADPRPNPDAGPAEAQECTMEKLPAPANARNPGVSAGDPSGRYLVGTAIFDGIDRVLLWTDGGQPAVLDPWPGKLAPDAVAAVNSSGVVTGAGTNDEGHERAWRYENGKYTVLPMPTGYGNEQVEVQGINSAGDIVGNVWNKLPGGPERPIRPVIWPAESPDKVRFLERPGGVDHVAAVDIADDGTILGQLGTTYKKNSVGYVWPDADSPGHRLFAEDGKKPATVEDISGNGRWVVGSGSWSSLPDGEDAALRWDLTTGKTTRHGEAFVPTETNNAGDVGTVAGSSSFVIFRADGSVVQLPGDVTFATVLFDSSSDLTAAGHNLVGDRLDPVVWRGC